MPADFSTAHWITTPRDGRHREPWSPADVGAWIWAQPDLRATEFELATTLTIAPHEHVTLARVVGVVKDGTIPVIFHTNGYRGGAGGQIQPAGVDFPCFEGEVSTWLHAGDNDLAIRVPGGVDAANVGVALRVTLEYADGSTKTIDTDAAWRARPAKPTKRDAFDARERRAPDLATEPIDVVHPAGHDDGVARQRFFQTPLPPPLLTKSFTLDAAVTRATLNVCGLGCHVAHVNGVRVGDHVLDPAQTSYEERAFHVTHDVTPLLAPGDNVLAVLLGDGWFGQNVAWYPYLELYGQPAAIATLVIEHADGRARTIVTDATWHAGEGPIRAANLHLGETYDARLSGPPLLLGEGLGVRAASPFQSSGRKANALTPALSQEERERRSRARVVPALTPRLDPQTIPPIRVIERLPPVNFSQPKPGVWVFDLGQNIGGWARLTVRGAAAGTHVRLRFGEAVDDAGLIDFRSTGVFATRCVQRDDYVCAGRPAESYEPTFTYHGFRYVEVTGLPGDVDGATIEGVVVHTDLAEHGTFECSDATLSRTESATRQALVSNLHGIVTDCPHRERCQWHGDLEVIADYALYRYDAAALFDKALDDVHTTLRGGLPTSIGVGRRLPPLNDLGWGSFLALVPWRIYLMRGDLGPARKHWDLARRTLDHFLDQRRPDGTLPAGGLGDHAWPPLDGQGRDVPPCPRPQLASMQMIEALDAMSRLAASQQKADESLAYAKLAADLRAATTKHFVDADGGFGHPTLDAYALVVHVVPDADRARLVDRFRDGMRRFDFMNVGGFHGYRRVAEAAILHLPEAEALDVLTQARHPGIAHAFAHGVASIVERHLPVGHREWFERSWNHFAFGGVCEHLWRHVAGLAPDPAAPGFATLVAAPRLTNVLAHASATYRSPRGPITTSWRRDAGGLAWTIDAPDGVAVVATPPHGESPPTTRDDGGG